MLLGRKVMHRPPFNRQCKSDLNMYDRFVLAATGSSASGAAKCAIVLKITRGQRWSTLKRTKTESSTPNKVMPPAGADVEDGCKGA